VIGHRPGCVQGAGERRRPSDPGWKYVNVHWHFAFLERSIENGTQSAAFEPNTPVRFLRVPDNWGRTSGGTRTGDDPFLTHALGGLVIGAAIGAGLDAAKRATIYRSDNARLSVSVSPIASAAGKGMGVRVRW